MTSVFTVSKIKLSSVRKIKNKLVLESVHTAQQQYIFQYKNVQKCSGKIIQTKTVLETEDCKRI